MKELTLVATGLYVPGIALLAALFRGVGERFWLLCPLVFMPILLWLLPLAVLVPATWKFERRLLPCLAVPLLVIVFGIGGYRLRVRLPSPTPGAGTLKVLTYNSGEDNNTSVVPFAKAEQPDLILLQDVKPPRRKPAFFAQFPDYHRKQIGDFVMLSRFPILTCKPILSGLEEWEDPVAAAFIVDWHGTPVTVYSVHFPTLRRDYWDLRGETPRSAKTPARRRVGTFRDRMKQRDAMIDEFSRLAANTSGAVLAVGDFNMPSWGHFHARVSQRLTDAFEVAGQGFGFTFPGFDPALPTFFGAWLRLDYLFCNGAWKPLSCKVEHGRASQHRAVVATFEAVGGKTGTSR